MIKVNVLSEENSWSKKIKKKELFFNKICNMFPKKYRFINKKIYLTLLLSNNKTIIISFNYINKPKNLDNYKFKIKTIKIFIHGFLHLLGHDHQKSKEYKQMLNEEKKIFRSIEKTSILN